MKTQQKVQSKRTTTKKSPIAKKQERSNGRPTTIALRSRTICDGNVVLFYRENSKRWQCRIRQYTGEWVDYSTKEADFGKAKKVAKERYRNILYRQEINKSLLIIGAGGHAVSIANVAIAANFEIAAFVDDRKADSKLIGIPVIKKEICESQFADGNYVVAIGDNVDRRRVYKELSKRLPKVKFPSIVHPSAVVSVKTTIGEGTVVMPNVTVGPNSDVGIFCILNTNSSIDHDCSLADFSSIAPGVTIGGEVEIGMLSAISIGATIKQRVTIGEHVVVGASSYVNKNMPSQVVCYGIPCKVVRNRKKGESYLG